MLKKFYLITASLALGFYAYSTLFGQEFGSTKLSASPPSESRSSAYGGRSRSGGGSGWGFGGGK